MAPFLHEATAAAFFLQVGVAANLFQGTATMNIRIQNAARTIADHLLGEELRLAEQIPVLEGRDPFGVADDCISAGGHEPIATEGGFVCFHCSRVIWR
jgi:hypothetical protein